MLVLAMLLLFAPSVVEAGTPRCHAGATFECSLEETSLLQVDSQLHHNLERAARGTLGNTNGTIEPKDICFVHVGKTGGESILSGLQELHVRGAVSNLLQVHSNHPEAYIEPGTGILTLPGPLSRADTFEGCANTGNVVLWLRDPVTRFVSLWNFFADPTQDHQLTESGVRNRQEQKQHVTEFVIDNSLNDIVNEDDLEDEVMFLGQLDIDQMLSRLFKNHNATVQEQFFDMIPHASTSFSWYYNACSSLSSLPIVFVGRQESMTEDWDAFLKKLGGVSVDLPHTHGTADLKKNRTLSQFAVDSLRRYYAQDYVCIAKLIELDFVQREYLRTITSDSQKYEY